MPKKDDEGESEVVEVAGRSFTVTNTDKVFFEERGETKLDLVRYYLAVGDAVLGAMGDRPTMLQRFPDGADGESLLPEAGAEERARLAADHDGRARRTAPPATRSSSPTSPTSSGP